MHAYFPFEDLEFLSFLLPVLSILLIAALLVAATVWLLGSIGLYKMCKNAGIPNAWLAFIPVADQYLIGLLAERAASVAGGRMSGVHFSHILLWGNVGLLLCSGLSMLLVLLSVPIALAGLALSVLGYIALYFIFNDYSPQNAVLFLVLSILLGIQWVFLFALRNRVPVSVAGVYPNGQPTYEPFPPAGGTTAM